MTETSKSDSVDAGNKPSNILEGEPNSN